MISHHLREVIANGTKPVPVVASFVSEAENLFPFGSYSVAVPSGTSSGDLLMMFIIVSGDVNCQLNSSGWSSTGGALYKYAGASESAYSFSSTGAGGEGTARIIIIRITGGTLTAVGALSSASGTTISVPSVTATANNTLLLCELFSKAASITYVLGSGFANVAFDQDATQPSVKIMSKTVPAGATGTISISASSGTTNYGRLYAIAPS